MPDRALAAAILRADRVIAVRDAQSKAEGEPSRSQGGSGDVVPAPPALAPPVTSTDSAAAPPAPPAPPARSSPDAEPATGAQRGEVEARTDLTQGKLPDELLPPDYEPVPSKVKLGASGNDKTPANIEVEKTVILRGLKHAGIDVPLHRFLRAAISAGGADVVRFLVLA